MKTEVPQEEPENNITEQDQTELPQEEATNENSQDCETNQELDNEPMEKTKKPKFKFKQMQLKAKGVIFVRMHKSYAEKISCDQLTEKVMDDIHKNQKQLSK